MVGNIIGVVDDDISKTEVSTFPFAQEEGTVPIAGSVTTSTIPESTIQDEESLYGVNNHNKRVCATNAGLYKNYKKASTLGRRKVHAVWGFFSAHPDHDDYWYC